MSLHRNKGVYHKTSPTICGVCTCSQPALQRHAWRASCNVWWVLYAGAGRGRLHGPDQQAGGWLLLVLARGTLPAAAAGVAPVPAAEWRPPGTPAAGAHRHPPSTTAQHAWSPRAGPGRDSPAEGEFTTHTVSHSATVSVRLLRFMLHAPPSTREAQKPWTPPV